jgi:hypothetical protein
MVHSQTGRRWWIVDHLCVPAAGDAEVTERAAPCEVWDGSHVAMGMTRTWNFGDTGTVSTMGSQLGIYGRSVEHDDPRGG